MRLLDRQQLEDIMIGATLLGAGGGGSPKSAITLVDKAVKASPTVRLASMDEVEDDATVCVVAGMGSPLAALKRDIAPELIRAFQFMQENVTRSPIQYVVPIEIGGGNTTVPSLVAAHTGATVVDADGAGRSIPQLEMTTYAIFGVPISPLVVTDPANNAVVVHTPSAAEGEWIARHIATSYASHAGIACHVMNGKTLKEVALEGTISFAGKVGETIRKAKEESGDIANAVLDVTGGWLLARGTVSSVTAETRDGFDFGSVEIVEEGNPTPLRVITQNENMIAYRGQKPVTIVPDLICFLDNSGQPLTNADMREGLRVEVIGIKSHAKWRQPKAWNVFTPALKRLGYDGGYVPIEDLLR